MKIIVQLAPDEVELVHSDLERDDFIVDQETYCYFRDDVFINDMEKFIKDRAPGRWQEIKGYDGGEKVKRWYDNQSLINKYYPEFNKIRKRFYLYNNEIYTYKFLGFLNVTNEIQLMKLEMKDVVQLLNELTEPLFKKVLKKMGIA